MVEGGITVEGADEFVSALKEYRDNIRNCINEALEEVNDSTEDEEYNEAAKEYIHGVSVLLESDLIKRVDATINAIEKELAKYKKEQGE